MRHFLSPADLQPAEVRQVLDTAHALKRGERSPAMSGLRVGALFMNPSLRTRVSFEQAASLLGGICQTLNLGTDSWAWELDPQAVMDGDSQECIVEAAGVLGRYFHVMGMRAFPASSNWSIEKREPVLKAFAEHCGRPLISLEGAMHHPCQSLADQMTLEEQWGDLRGRKVALCWGWHPRSLPMAVPNSFALQMVRAGADLRIVHPQGYELDPELTQHLSGAPVYYDRETGLEGCEAVYVKSWGRMDGQPNPDNLRHWVFDKEAWSHTASAKVMHCLPVRRNVVISSEMLDSEHSIVLDEAENRMWAQAALMEFMVKVNGVTI